MKNKSGYIYEGSEDLEIDPEDVKNIHVIENFISSEDLITLNNYIENSQFVLDEYGVHEFPLESLMFDKEMYMLMAKYREQAMLILGETFDCTVAMSEIASLIKYATGTNLNEHADKICESWRDLSTSIYYNDGYKGGELFFSQYDLSFEPKAGMMIYFPAGGNYAHGVNTITEGTRYATTTFWKVEKWNSIQYS
jgi:hypothetical protein